MFRLVEHWSIIKGFMKYMHNKDLKLLSQIKHVW